MANPKIGAYEFITLKYGNAPLGENVEEITRPGVDGISYRKTGKRVMQFNMTGLATAASAAAVKTLVENYKKLQGTLVTVRDDILNSWTLVMVLQVEYLGSKLVATPVGGSKYVVRSRWTLQDTKVP